MAVIKVPKTPKKSYNPHRKPSALLLDQVRHLQWAALPAKQRKPKAMAKRPLPKTEWQAAEHIRELTALVEANKTAYAQSLAAGAPPTTVPTVTLPPLPRAKKSARPATRQAKRRRAKASKARGQTKTTQPRTTARKTKRAKAARATASAKGSGRRKPRGTGGRK